LQESLWGVTPTGNFKALNFSAESFASENKTKVSKHIRSDRQSTDLMVTSSSVGGGIETELQFGNVSPLLHGFLWGTWELDTPMVGTDTLVNGVTRYSYSIERSNNDIAQFFLYTGMTPNTMEVTIDEGEPVTVKFGFVGKEEVLTQTGKTVDAPVADPVFDASNSVTEVAVDGTPLAGCVLQKLSFTLNQKAEGKNGVGSPFPCSVSGKSVEITGGITLYFTDETYYTKYKNATAFALKVSLADTDGNVYIFELPRCIFDKAKANVTGKDDDVLFEATFVASVNKLPAPDDYMIKVTRTAA